MSRVVKNKNLFFELYNNIKLLNNATKELAGLEHVAGLGFRKPLC